MTKERRHYNRVNFAVDASLAFPDTSYAGELIDISLKGVLFRPERNIVCRIGQPCVLEFRLGEESRIIRMKSRIAHCDKSKVGIYCQCMDLDSATHLRRLLELNLGDAKLLERDLDQLSSA